MSWFRNDEADKRLKIGPYAKQQPNQGPNNPVKRPDMSGVDVNAALADLEAKSKKNGDNDWYKKVDWMPLVTGAGGLLLAHSLGSALVGRKSGEEERRQSIWERLLSVIIPIGLAGAGGYGGYRLGKFIKQSADGTTSQSQPEYTAEDLLDYFRFNHRVAGDARDQMDLNAWMTYVPSALSGAAGLTGVYNYFKGIYDIKKYNKLNTAYQAMQKAKRNAVGESAEASANANAAKGIRSKAEAYQTAHPKSKKAQLATDAARGVEIKAIKDSAKKGYVAKSMPSLPNPEAPFGNFGVGVKATPKGPIPVTRPWLLGTGSVLSLLSYLGFKAGNNFSNSAKEYSEEADKYQRYIERMNKVMINK
jgi:hypothetical protein